MNALLKRVGYKGDKENRPPVNEIPNYRADMRQVAATSDCICGNGTKKDANVYTGDELMGIGTMHKSNAVPIRKDSDEVKNISKMRR